MTTVPTDLAALAPMDVAARAGRLRGAMADQVEALLVTSLTNIRYLTGFTGSAALLLVTADDLLFVTDGRYGAQAIAQLAAAGVSARIEVAGADQRAVLQAAVAQTG
ncbi:MAG: Xaa-Pro aminopeptidase, partial [Acidimicrobiales bacterium]|nr:Xaa-Pro aminopeptidase [Acidimicrobiales bacterium]